MQPTSSIKNRRFLPPTPPQSPKYRMPTLMYIALSNVHNINDHVQYHAALNQVIGIPYPYPEVFRLSCYHVSHIYHESELFGPQFKGNNFLLTDCNKVIGWVVNGRVQDLSYFY